MGEASCKHRKCYSMHHSSVIPGMHVTASTMRLAAAEARLHHVARLLRAGLRDRARHQVGHHLAGRDARKHYLRGAGGTRQQLAHHRVQNTASLSLCTVLTPGTSKTA